KATTDGVRRAPSSLEMTLGSLPSMIATTELVVPRSMPMILPICVVPRLQKICLLANLRTRQPRVKVRLLRSAPEPSGQPGRPGDRRHRGQDRRQLTGIKPDAVGRAVRDRVLGKRAGVH